MALQKKGLDQGCCLSPTDTSCGGTSTFQSSISCDIVDECVIDAAERVVADFSLNDVSEPLKAFGAHTKTRWSDQALCVDYPCRLTQFVVQVPSAHQSSPAPVTNLLIGFSSPQVDYAKFPFDSYRVQLKIYVTNPYPSKEPAWWLAYRPLPPEVRAGRRYVALDRTSVSCRDADV